MNLKQLNKLAYQTLSPYDLANYKDLFEKWYDVFYTMYTSNRIEHDIILYQNTNAYKNVKTIDEFISYMKLYLKKYPQPLYEMAMDRRTYNIKTMGLANSIHYTIINIICLGDTICPETNNHGKSELLGFIKQIITISVEKSVNKRKIILDNIIIPFTDNYKYGHYTYDNSYMYEQAMNDEIRKAEKPNAKTSQKRISKYIKHNIMPNIDKFVEPNKDRVSKLFDALIDVCKTENMSIFEKAVDEFINTDVELYYSFI